MFGLNYRILEKLDELKYIKLKEIKETDVHGFIKLDFNDSEAGLILDKNQLSDEEAINKNVFLYNDLLFIWFEDLLTTLKYISSYDNVLLHEIDTLNTHFQFNKNKDNLNVRYLDLNISCRKRIQYGDSSKILDKNVLKIHWQETISFLQFKEEVLSYTQKFLNEVLEINPNFKYNWKFVNIKNLIDELENI